MLQVGSGRRACESQIFLSAAQLLDCQPGRAVQFRHFVSPPAMHSAHPAGGASQPQRIEQDVTPTSSHSQ